jgi:hypothetical protein
MRFAILLLLFLPACATKLVLGAACLKTEECDTALLCVRFCSSR